MVKDFVRLGKQPASPIPNRNRVTTADTKLNAHPVAAVKNDHQTTMRIKTRRAPIRSGGLLFVRAANEGRTIVEMFPREKITQDFETLAERLIGPPAAAPVPEQPFRIFGRQKEPARA